MPEIVMGTNTEKFVKNKDVYYMDGLLYYGEEGKLTDTYYIKYPSLGGTDNKVGKVFEGADKVSHSAMFFSSQN